MALTRVLKSHLPSYNYRGPVIVGSTVTPAKFHQRVFVWVSSFLGPPATRNQSNRCFAPLKLHGKRQKNTRDDMVDGCRPSQLNGSFLVQSNVSPLNLQPNGTMEQYHILFSCSCPCKIEKSKDRAGVASG